MSVLFFLFKAKLLPKVVYSLRSSVWSVFASIPILVDNRQQATRANTFSFFQPISVNPSSIVGFTAIYRSNNLIRILSTAALLFCVMLFFLFFLYFMTSFLAKNLSPNYFSHTSQGICDFYYEFALYITISDVVFVISILLITFLKFFYLFRNSLA